MANNSNKLVAAIKVSDIESLNSLLAGDTDVNALDDEGYLPLNYAACIGDKAIITALLDAGADVTAENQKGDTPLDNVPADVDSIVQELLSLARLDAHLCQIAGKDSE